MAIRGLGKVISPDYSRLFSHPNASPINLMKHIGHQIRPRSSLIARQCGTKSHSSQILVEKDSSPRDRATERAHSDRTAHGRASLFRSPRWGGSGKNRFIPADETLPTPSVPIGERSSVIKKPAGANRYFPQFLAIIRVGEHQMTRFPRH